LPDGQRNLANLGTHAGTVRPRVIQQPRYLLTEAGLRKNRPEAIDVGELARYDRPLPTTAEYDVLLSGPCAGSA
jgi:hypothetical protein